MSPKLQKMPDRIREAAKKLGGIRSLANQSGIREGTLANWLSGTEPRVNALNTIAVAAGVTLDWLVAGREPRDAVNLTAQSDVDSTAGLPDRIRDAAKKLGGIRSLANKSGIGESTMANWLAGVEPRVNALNTIAVAAGVTLDWLVAGRVPKDAVTSPPRSNLDPTADLSDQTRSNTDSASRATLPVLGMASCGADGWASIENSALRAAPSINIGKNAFAVISAGDSMQPFGIFNGSLCFCDPDIAPNTGDTVCIERKGNDEQTYISIKKIGVMATDSVEIFGYRKTEEIRGKEMQEVFWEIVKKSDILRMSVVNLINLKPLLC